MDIRALLTGTITIFSEALMIFGGVVPYIPQYMMIKRTQNSDGFSNYVCLTLLIANILRVEFWFGKRFETPLLLQSIIMIGCMLVMLELCIRLQSRSSRHHLPTSSQMLPNGREILTEQVERRFTDFQREFFWKWTNFSSYTQFLLSFSAFLSCCTWLFINSSFYVETIGFLAVFFEALLGMPQYAKNYRLKSTEGMSVTMVLMWTSGDIFKTVYFFLRQAPPQFWICGSLQISIDLAILTQVFMYSEKYRFRKR